MIIKESSRGRERERDFWLLSFSLLSSESAVNGVIAEDGMDGPVGVYVSRMNKVLMQGFIRHKQ